tara:strand:- start:356 stop:1729 length:1374 start_codon:yes stop_codon:yes gene_type:complete
MTGSAETADIANDAVTPAKMEFGAFFYATATGTNTIALTTGNSLASLTEGTVIAFKAANTCTDAVDVNVDGIGAVNLYRHGSAELQPDDLKAGAIYEIRYDGTNFEIVSQLGQPEVHVGEDAGSTDDYAITFSPAPSAWRTNQTFLFKANTVSEPGATLNANSLGAKTLKKQKDQDLSLGDIKAGQWVKCVYDGTNLQLLTPPSNTQAPGIPGTSAGLQLAPNASNPNNQIDIDADWLAVTDSSGNAKILKDVDLTLDISTTPAAKNALDTSITEAASTGYWVYVCFDQASGEVFGLFSTNSSSPATSVAYTHWAKLGWVYNDSSGHFAQYAVHRSGRWLFTSAEITPETTGGTEPQTWQLTHPFNRRPDLVRSVGRCVTADNGYVAGEEVDTLCFGNSGEVNHYSEVFARASITNMVLLQRILASSIRLTHADGPLTTDADVIDGDRWRWVVRAEF